MKPGARARNLGWSLEHEPLADLHLVVDGRRIDPEARDLCARFLVPVNAKDVWLVSDTGVPAEVETSTDVRRLGVCVGALVVDGFDRPRTIRPTIPDFAPASTTSKTARSAGPPVALDCPPTCGKAAAVASSCGWS